MRGRERARERERGVQKGKDRAREIESGSEGGRALSN